MHAHPDLNFVENHLTSEAARHHGPVHAALQQLRPRSSLSTRHHGKLCVNVPRASTSTSAVALCHRPGRCCIGRAKASG